MTTIKILLILPLTFILSGCIIVSGDSDWDGASSTGWKAEQNQNRDSITKLTLGLQRSDVLSKMGTPAFSEAFTGENDSEYTILYYRTHRKHGDGETTKDETTAIVFENDILIGWGNDALQRIH